MDGKLVLGFMLDVLYIKGVINFDEFEAFSEARNAEDLGELVERLLRSDFNQFRRGEAYGTLI